MWNCHPKHRGTDKMVGFYHMYILINLKSSSVCVCVCVCVLSQRLLLPALMDYQLVESFWAD